MDRENGMAEEFDARQEIESLKLDVAVQAATQAGAQATQAAAQAGQAATTAAAQAGQAAATAASLVGMGAAMASGMVMFIVGIFLGLTIHKTR